MRRYANPSIKQWVDELKSSTPCLVCKVCFPPEAMDFDHVRGRKRKNVSSMVRYNWSRELIEAEIAKCDLVCANCHRTLTKERRIARNKKRTKRKKK